MVVPPSSLHGNAGSVEVSSRRMTAKVLPARSAFTGAEICPLTSPAHRSFDSTRPDMEIFATMSPPLMGFAAAGMVTDPRSNMNCPSTTGTAE